MSSGNESQYFSTTSARTKSRRRPRPGPHLQPSSHRDQTKSTPRDRIQPIALPISDDTLSDSSLSDPPSDLDNPFADDDPLILAALSSKSIRAPKKRILHTRSPYFPKKHREPTSCLPFPSTSTETFGLMQEKLAHDPFRLIIATIFLNRTRGEQAMPVYYQLMERYPTVEMLSIAEQADVVSMIHKLGFQNQRARKCIALAKAWLERPPTKNKRYRKIDYPKKGDGRDVGPNESVTDEDTRVGWEIAGLPGVGAYALDSWRIFCRDTLRGLQETGDGNENSGFEPEWTRVLPSDKELRAYLTWMWLKRGFAWNKETGERTKADEKMLERGAKGGIVRETGKEWTLESPIKKFSVTNLDIMEPAGVFLPGEKEK